MLHSAGYCMRIALTIVELDASTDKLLTHHASGTDTMLVLGKHLQGCCLHPRNLAWATEFLLGCHVSAGM